MAPTDLLGILGEEFVLTKLGMDRSLDGGRTWRELDVEDGFPKFPMGRHWPSPELSSP